MRWPDVLPAGKAIGAFVQNTLDIGPTLLDAAGLNEIVKSGNNIFDRNKKSSDNKKSIYDGNENYDRTVDGCSLFPLFGGGIPAGWRDCAVSTYNGQQFGLYTQRMIRDNEWKYIWNTADIDELYNLRADPGELNNRVYDPECAETLKSLRRRLHDILIKEGDGLLKNYWLRDQLQGKTIKT
jgi:arylsulfatase A-like enzyme